MSKLLSGSMCLTQLIELAKKKHSAFNKASNGKIYFNLSIWLNDQPDKYDNDASIQINPKKDSEDSRDYIGNAHYIELNQQAPVTESDVEQLPDGDDLPF